MVVWFFFSFLKTFMNLSRAYHNYLCCYTQLGLHTLMDEVFIIKWCTRSQKLFKTDLNFDGELFVHCFLFIFYSNFILMLCRGWNFQVARKKTIFKCFQISPLFCFLLCFCVFISHWQWKQKSNRIWCLLSMHWAFKNSAITHHQPK